MGEHLFIRASRQQDVETLWWLWHEVEEVVLDSGVILGSYDGLDSLAKIAEGRRTYILLSTADVILKTAELPIATRVRRPDKVIPFLLEETLASDIEELHFSLLNREKNKLHIAVTDATWLTQMLSKLEQIGIEVRRILPDVLAIPLQKKELLLRLGSEYLIRRDKWTGCVIPEGWESYCSLSGPTTPMLPDDTSTYTVLSKGAIAADVTLLTGEFIPKSERGSTWLIWKKNIYAVLALITLFTGTVSYQTYQLGSQAQELSHEAQRIFRTVFPNKKRIPTAGYLKSQISSEINRLSVKTESKGVLQVLEILASLIGESGQIELLTLSYYNTRGAEFKIEIEGASFQVCEALSTELSHFFLVHRGSLSKRNEGVLSSITLSEKQDDSRGER